MRLSGTALLLAFPALMAGQAMKLTLQEAEALALKNQPQIHAARNDASAMTQEVREAKAPYYPVVNADLTGSQANVDARIGAGVLTDSRLFSRFGQGITLSQLVTDFGRTGNLVASSKLRAAAAGADVQATQYDTLLGVNQAYFSALEAEAVVKVAQETVATRQTLLDQVSALQRNQLKSQLDVSFAQVNVSDAKLMLIRAQNNVEQAFAQLALAIGASAQTRFDLAEEAAPPGPPAQADALIADALKSRPEIASLRDTSEAARRFADAEKDLSRPAVNLEGVAGFLPLINASGIPNKYEAVAVNLDFPVFNGHLFAARREAADYRAAAVGDRQREMELRVTRDVRVAWTNASTAYQRLAVTAQYVTQAKLAVKLAQGRYNLGLASIIELTQSQLNLTRAEIEDLSAHYDYQSLYATLQYAIGALR